MPTCKECIHYEPCKDSYYNAEQLSRFPLGFLEKENAEKNCAFFKDRSKFVEPPCKVGGVFYGIDTYGINAYSCYGVGYGYISANKLGFLLFAVGRREYIFGEDAFLTEEEAEQALRRREK